MSMILSRDVVVFSIEYFLGDYVPLAIIGFYKKNTQSLAWLGRKETLFKCAKAKLLAGGITQGII